MASLPFAPPDPAALLRALKARAHEAGLNTRDQHTVSQALLRRFTRSVPGNKWQLSKIDLLHAPVHGRFDSPKGSGVIPEFVPFASTSLEQYWSLIENRFHAAFAAVDDRSVFSRPDQLSAVLDMAALHFARSPQMKQANKQSFRAAIESTKALMIRLYGRQDLNRFYQEETGIIVDGGVEPEYVVGHMLKDLVDLAESGAVLRERVVAMYEDARACLNFFRLEILEPESGEFLIGDIPAVTVNAGTGALGVLGGVPLLDADSLVLPLGRDRLAWFHRGAATGYRVVPVAEVERLNRIQVLAAQEYVFTHPLSMLEGFVAQVCKDRPPV